MEKRKQDRMPDFAFRMMSATFALKDLFFPSVHKRAASFGIREGMTVVDYGCGPGRYTIHFARLVGPQGNTDHRLRGLGFRTCELGIGNNKEI